MRRCRRAVLVGVVQVALAEGVEGAFDAVAQRVEGARALFLGEVAPLLEQAVLGLVGLDAALVQGEVEQHEVGVDLAVEHGFEVELEVGLAGEAVVVA